MGGSSWAGEREEAELQRLVEDMNSMAEQSQWAGAERAYQRMLELEDASIPFEAHYIAAQSARTTGDMALVLERLELAARIKRPPGLNEWIEEVEGSYGRVEISCASRRHPELKPLIPSFNPDKRKQIEFARAAIQESCSFKGLLPGGKYTLGKLNLEVVPGMTIRLDLGG